MSGPLIARSGFLASAAGLAAVKAGRLYPCSTEAPYSYQGYAAFLEGLVANLKKAKPLQ
ncbi:hypothetical protein AB0I81_20920 [Nonomuraea sp. NPDC050404]|uniref:hypothetical protein n=1 Tax=Nonomuraea sp. NPDC050404 TaxID=3155783 RepID=UPI0033DBF693